MTPHSAYVRHPLHCRWHHIRSITPNHSIYDVTSTSGMIWRPLYQTLHPLYLCHQNLSANFTRVSNDITETFCVTSYALYITSHPVLMSSHYCTYDIKPLYIKPHPVCRATYTLYMRHHSHYLCPHTHCIDNITSTLCMTSHSLYVWHRLHYTRHHILNLWPQTTVFMPSHQLYLTLCPLYLCHHIHCINDITQTLFLRSHLL